MSVNDVKNCCVSNCVNRNIVARKRRTTDTPNGTPWSNKKHIATFRYFCTDHFDPAKEETKVQVFPPFELIVSSDDYNRPLYSKVYSNRKRKSSIARWRPQRSKFKDGEQSYTLTERDPSNDDTVVDIQFEFVDPNSEDYADGEPKLVVPDEKSKFVEPADDNDCIITEVPSTNVIDLSDDEMEGCNSSNKMIEVILCNDIEPEDSEATREFVIDTSTYEEWNGLVSQEVQEPLQVNFCVLEDSTNDAIHTIDLTSEETNENTTMDIVDNVQTLPKITSVRTIDLTEQLMSTDDVDDVNDTHNEVLEKVIRDFSNKYPGTLKSISRNGENNQLEIELCKNGLFKSEDEFKLYIMKVANLIQESQFEGVVINEPLDDTTQEDLIDQPTSLPALQVKDFNEMQAVERSCVVLNKDFPPKQQGGLKYSRLAKKVINGQHSDRSNESSSSTLNNSQTVKSFSSKNTETVSNANHPPKQQGASKYYLPLPAKKIINSQYEHRFNENSSSSSDNPGTVNHSKLARNTEIVSNYNASQILKKSKTYLGVTKTTFHTIEHILKNRFKNKSVLILLLRKIKLNESFSMLSDVLCPNTLDCISIYEEVLPELSRALQIFLRWPTHCRDNVAVVAIFEIEIKKPDSLIEQNMSFCCQRQRYIVKFLVSCTSSGYINHVSMPFYSIQAKIFTKCLLSIPKNCSVVVHPNLLDFISQLTKSTRIKSFDIECNAYRKCIQSVFDRMRRFSLLNGIVDRTNSKLLLHAVSVVACLCNFEEK